MQPSRTLTGTLSSSNLTDVAARVVEEFRHENGIGHGYDDIFNYNNCDHYDDEFEFDIVCTDVHSYPLFDQSLLLDVDPNINIAAKDDCKSTERVPLRKLFSEDRDFGSSSSSEADDLGNITPGTYCVLMPKTLSLSERCKKSNSTGNSSRRWKFLDILYRSNSESKETPFVLFNKPLIATNKKAKKKVEKRTLRVF